MTERLDEVSKLFSELPSDFELPNVREELNGVYKLEFSNGKTMLCSALAVLYAIGWCKGYDRAKEKCLETGGAQ